MLQLILINIAVSIIVGLLGRNRKFGFWGYFFASLLLTPILGLLLVQKSAGGSTDFSVGGMWEF